MTALTPSVRHRLFAAEQYEPDLLARRKRFGTVVLGFSIIVSLISVVSALFLPKPSYPLAGLAVVALLTSSTLLVALGRGYVNVVNSITTVFGTLLLIASAHFADGIYGSSAPLLLVTLAYTPFLVPRPVFISNLISTLVGTTIVLMYELNGNPPMLPLSGGSLSFSYALSIVILAAIMYYFSEGLNSAVRRLTAQSADLSRANQELTHQQQARQLAAEQVSTAANHMAAFTGEQTVRVREAVGTFNQTQASAEELSRISQQIAAVAAEVRGAAASTLQQSRSTQEQVADGIGEIALVLGQVNVIASTVSTLEESSRGIGLVVTSIQEIADEVRLLALNAAIEAAGAGSYGRRFGVIASEVSSLSDSAEQQTRIVSQQLQQLQAAIQAVAGASKQGIALAGRSEHYLRSIGQAATQINNLSDQTDRLADSISQTTSQQRLASQEVVEQMRTLVRLAQSEADSATVGAEAASNLRLVASGLADSRDYAAPSLAGPKVSKPS